MDNCKDLFIYLYLHTIPAFVELWVYLKINSLLISIKHSFNYLQLKKALTFLVMERL